MTAVNFFCSLITTIKRLIVALLPIIFGWLAYYALYIRETPKYYEPTKWITEVRVK